MLAAIISFVIFMHYRFVRKSIREFKTTINSVNQGNLEKRLSIPETKELGQLGAEFNSMLDTFRDVMEKYKNRAYDAYEDTPHGSMEWEQIDWERKNISLLYSGVVCREGTGDREDLINALRKEIAKRASI